MSDWAQGTSPLAIPGGGGGGGLYDFGYQSDNLPASAAASTASQLESGGSAFDWNKGLKDLLGAWVASESKNSSEVSQAPVQYRRAEDGRLYVTDPAYRGTMSNATIAGIPVLLIVAGAVLYFAMKKG